MTAINPKELLDRSKDLLIQTEPVAESAVDALLIEWSRAQLVHDPSQFVVQVGLKNGAYLWGVLGVDADSAHYDIKPHVECLIPFHTGEQTYDVHERAFPWMGEVNRAVLSGGGSADGMSATTAYNAMGMRFGAKYGPFDVSTSGSGDGELTLLISEYEWTVYPDSFMRAFRAAQGKHQAVARTALYTASAVFGGLVMAQHMPLTFAPSEQHIVLMDRPPFE